jgi:hypothetical protein
MSQMIDSRLGLVPLLREHARPTHNSRVTKKKAQAVKSLFEFGGKSSDRVRIPEVQRDQVNVRFRIGRFDFLHSLLAKLLVTAGHDDPELAQITKKVFPGHSEAK